MECGVKQAGSLPSATRGCEVYGQGPVAKSSEYDGRSVWTVLVSRGVDGWIRDVGTLDINDPKSEGDQLAYSLQSNVFQLIWLKEMNELISKCD